MFGINVGGLFTGPVDAVLKVGDDAFKKHAVKSILGALYSAIITGLFEAGQKKLLGFGVVLQKVARSIFLSLRPMADNGLLVLAVPKTLLDPEELKKFESEYSQKL